MFYEEFMHLCKVTNERPTKILKAIGVSSGSLANWKKGSSVNSEILILISDYFNVSVDYLLGREEQVVLNTIADCDIQTGDSADTKPNSDKQYDKTDLQVAEMFSKMDIKDKAKVLKFMIELIERNC